MSSASTPSQRLAQLGLSLPSVPAPVASYTPALCTGTLVYTSGQLPFVNGQLPTTGKVGDNEQQQGSATLVSPATATDLARTAALNAVAAAAGLVGLDNITQVVKLTGFVASAPGFHGQPGVLNGASSILQEIFGEAGVHARSAVGVSELPLDSPVEVEIIFSYRG